MRSVVLGGVLALGIAAGHASAVELTVSAAASLQDAFTEIKTAYEAQSSDTLTLNFGASGSLAQQVKNGAPVDVFVSAASRPVDELEAAGKVAAASRRILARNGLVVVAPHKGRELTHLEDLKADVIKRVAFGEPGTVPAGQYAQEALIKLRMWDAVKPKIVYAQNVRQVLTYVQTGNVDAGFVYATDAHAAKGIRVVAVVDPALHAPIEYPAVVVATSKHLEAAKAFVAYLAGPQCAAVLTRLGFAPGKDPS